MPSDLPVCPFFDLKKDLPSNVDCKILDDEKIPEILVEHPLDWINNDEENDGERVIIK
jgi:hypothetical protein